MSFLKNLDLYKSIILGSLLCLPIALGFVYWVNGELEVAKTALKRAEQANGELERIGQLQQQLETISRNVAKGGQSDNHRLFFEQRIVNSVKDGGLRSSDFEIGNQVPARVAKLKAVDQTTSISFSRGGKPLPLSREFIYAVLFNCEAGGSQVWKLRDLDMVNEEAKSAMRGRSAPPKTVKDLWLMQKLVFARREPQSR